jgi:hypothetical protein
MRFRATAFPKARGVVNPTRGPPASGSRRQKAANKGLE